MLSPISLKRTETFTHKGYRVPDPFAPREQPGISLLNAVLATALFRCWHILVFFTAWSTLITVLNHKGFNLTIQPTLLTVIGTVLGFVISYRTTSSFERYNEGRRLWSQIILASRTFARLTWFHVPEPPLQEGLLEEETRARSMIERKTIINLIEAFSVSVKHYLRGEDGIYYEDLYYLVKFLPAYAFPYGMPAAPSMDDTHVHDEVKPHQRDINHLLSDHNVNEDVNALATDRRTSFSNTIYRSISRSESEPQLPAPVTQAEPAFQRRSSLFIRVPPPMTREPDARAHHEHHRNDKGRKETLESLRKRDREVLNLSEESLLLPAHMPPSFGFFDCFPFAFLFNSIPGAKGKAAARHKARMQRGTVSHNLPLEISLYLSSYIAMLQRRKQCDVPTTNALFLSLGQLVDSLTGLERILTTPIPFSYSVHLWVVTLIYCFALPPQIWSALHWLTIPATAIASFIFFGFLVAGEEIENPFGYDKNDLNLDHFTKNIIRNELRAITSTAAPDPARWAFVPENNLLFSDSLNRRTTPEEWIRLGCAEMQKELSMH